MTLLELIDKFLSNPISNSPLVLLGTKSPVRDEAIQYICQSVGVIPVEHNTLFELFQQYSTHQRNTWLAMQEFSAPMLVIDDLDAFAGKPASQKELEHLILLNHSPIVLALESYDELSWGLRRIIAESVMIMIKHDTVIANIGLTES